MSLAVVVPPLPNEMSLVLSSELSKAKSEVKGEDLGGHNIGRAPVRKSGLTEETMKTRVPEGRVRE